MVAGIVVLVSVGIAFLSAGCSVFRDPSAIQSVKNDRSMILVTQADKRAVFTFEDKNKAFACPEPSPDVRVDIESAVKALLEASANLPETITATAKSELDASRKLITAALLERSQGLQGLRDMLFQACLANLRGDMDRERYVLFVTNALPTLTATLITTEMVTKGNDGKPILSGPDLKELLSFVIKR
jgi:hypothetical protein